MPQLNPEHAAAVIGLINRAPFFALLSMEVLELGKGRARVAIDLQEMHLNPFGGVHGGVYSSLIDTAAYWAVYGDVAEDAGLISIDLKVDNLAPVRQGRIVAEGKRIKAGRSICMAEAAVTDERGRYLAHGTSKQMVASGLQTMAQLLATMGHGPLPPKFLGGK